PFNALSNGAFLIAAGIAFAAWGKAGGADRMALALIALIATIGVGSFLFHIFANGWSMMADVLPITVFIYAMFALVFHRYVGLGFWGTLLCLAVFFGATMLLEPALRPFLGGSAGYAPALIAMAGVGLYLCSKAHPYARTILFAAAVFALSLTLRTLDVPACEVMPVGTHMLWHMLNAVVLGTLLTGAVRIR
ncbi:MAG: ceramidase domain-containing protein, partial [Alphaproteobacteria bacterium]